MQISDIKLPRLSFRISFKYLIIAIYPILSIYMFLPGLTYGNLSVIFYLIFKLLVSRKIRIDFPFLIIMIIFICSNLLQLIINPDVSSILVSHNTYSMLLFLVVTITLIADSEEDMMRLYKYLKIVSVLSSLGIICQFISWTLFHTHIFLFIPGIKRIAYVLIETYRYRPSSFFTEPSHFAIYILPVFTLSLLKRDYYYSIFFLLALIFSTSSLGIISAVVLLLWHFRNIFRHMNSNKTLKIVIVLVSIVLFLTFIESDIITFGLNKLFTIFDKASRPRLWGSLHYISFFGIREYVFGIGLNQFSYLVNMKLGIDIPNFSNSLVFSFISFGIIGLFFWVLYIYMVIKRLPKNYIALGIIFLCVCAIDQVLFNQNLLYLLVILSFVTRTKGFQTTISELS
jgi:hypothetical protein